MNTDKITLYHGDCFDILPTIKEESVDLIFADPPYFLSSGGISCSSGKMVCVDKGDWDKKSSDIQMHAFNSKWISESKRVLKKSGTILICGTHHNIYSIGMALIENGFKILNNITWQKTNPPPNLSCRYFTHSTEYIIWAKKDAKAKHTFNYELMKELNNNKQMKDVITGPCINRKEKEFGYHPTQKPLYLLEHLILAITNQNDLILDPFSGTGTTLVAAYKTNRKAIGIEIENQYIQITNKRLDKEFNNAK
ncbi:DNA-methyltransferase [Ureaplasma diversum]|uniref:Methyltransferase n=1 Tax=Ureaplasma diversum NCTC 246 TaxID=1188241 RepID=A0A084EZ91_9BACT|nr:site-specific DNA-methyltransferase [Ureaplasma diversum]KEZ23283.1 Modification methylase [Ureaplasma diversum NCTC 246]